MTSGRRRTGTAAACCALLAAALLGGCTGSGGSGASADTASRVRALLDARARAVLHHDRAAFLATVDPAAPGLRAAQGRVFDNLRRLPLSGFRYRVRSTGAFPLAGRHQVAVDAELDYALRGYDAAPVTGDAYLTLTRRDGHWYLSSQTGGEAAGRHTTVQPWDQGPVTVVTGRRSLVIGRGRAAGLRTYAGLADRAVPVVRAGWPGAWPGRAVLEVPGTEADMAALLGAPASSYRGIAAVTTAELRGTARAPADRVLVNPQAFAQLSPLGRRVVLTHELTHVATRTATTPATPTWLSEGFADLVGYRGTGRTPQQIAPELRADVRAGRAPHALPTTADFATTAPGLPQAYEGGWLACRMIAEQWGQDRLVAFYRAAGRDGVDRALRGTLDTDPARFTARWRAYVAKELA